MSLAGYSPLGHKKLDMTKGLTHTIQSQYSPGIIKLNINTLDTSPHTCGQGGKIIFNIQLKSWTVGIKKNDYILKYWDYVRLSMK